MNMNEYGCIFCLEVSSSPPFSKLNRAIKINDFKRKLNDFRILGKFKQDIGKCQTKSQIFHSTLPPHLTRGRGGRVNLKYKNTGGLVLTYFPSHLADSKFLLLITRGRHRVPVILLSLRFHLVKRKSQ